MDRAGCFVLIIVAYWVIWARWTPIFDRKRYLAPQVIFGLMWGVSIGQIFLVLWHFAGISTAGAAVSMRVPPFWVKDYIHAPRTAPGLFGIPHAVGYVPEEK
jgi:hypothetical protein